MVQDLDTIKVFMRHRIEDSILEILQNYKYEDKILSQAFKIIILMHI